MIFCYVIDIIVEDVCFIGRVKYLDFLEFVWKEVCDF